ncbi:MAG: hypothetical protein J6B85_05160 [Lachnospiraceae bacterium]|nr:hypothetical protein [Lachnospiraceae bacterium]
MTDYFVMNTCDWIGGKRRMSGFEAISRTGERGGSLLRKGIRRGIRLLTRMDESVQRAQEKRLQREYREYLAEHPELKDDIAADGQYWSYDRK